MDICIDKEKNKQTDRQTADRQTDRQTDKFIYRWTEGGTGR